MAAELHGAMVKHIVDTVAQWGKCDIQLWCAPDPEHDLFQELSHEYLLTLHTQEGADLGQRMHIAFMNALKDYGSTIIVGADCPSINQPLLEQAASKLTEGMDAVIAPAIDGGYVLLGLKDAHPELFSGIGWGTSDVFDQTVQRLELLGLSWYQLEDQWDVDRAEDVLRLKNLANKVIFHPDLQTALDEL